MKTTYLIGMAMLVGVMNACQPKQESAPPPSPVMSSIYKEGGNEELEITVPETAGAREADASFGTQQEVLQYINEARAQGCNCGSQYYPPAPALSLNSRLNGASNKHAVDMADYNYFSHTGRDGSQPWDRMTREGYQWIAAGENIAAGFTASRSVVNAWLNSPGHCANIMNPNFQNLGVGCGYNINSNYDYYWVTLFGTRR
ncbi:CAP domain-containing protein [Spirosoma sp. BT702]|uniref:CAP domain-containing protein n=1 Tax=Spirosoma profusum TaxID=2771354 RepID=A0A926Y1S7_9BACT|nr:CAP domain-containing protein [Spirosoma profusum]MBD2700296.1 CAP domain-containing protein [Spirosoma profusum]